MAESVTVEFTIEPFTEGAPGPHVTTSIAALEAMGIAVDVGPFGSSFSAPPERAAEAVSVLVSTAYANGATHVVIDTNKAK
jgi:uncharacterized protein YqgV (UPF0045/DUF77 family)